MGFRTVALSTDASKEPAALAFGADAFVHTPTQPSSSTSNGGDASDPVSALHELSDGAGAKVVVATAVNAAATAGLIDSLAVGGTLLVLAAEPAPMHISPREC